MVFTTNISVHSLRFKVIGSYYYLQDGRNANT